MKTLKDTGVDVIVTVKHNSSRVIHKNTKEFFSGKSLLDIKLQQLLRVVDSDHIILLGNSEYFADYAEKYGVHFVCETEYAPGAPLTDGILKHTKSEEIIRVCVTTPFLDEKVLLSMWQQYMENKHQYDSCVSVERIQCHLLSQHGHRLNYGLGFDYLMSQELEPIYSVKFGIFIINRSIASRIHYFIGNRPLLYECDTLQSFDINYPNEFEQAQQLLHIPQFRACVE